MRILTTIALVFIFFLSLNHVSADQEWDKAKEGHGITVFTRLPDGSQCKEFKAVTEIDASLTSLVAVLADVESLPEWYKNLGEVKLLEQLNDHKAIYYSEILTPFPFKNRDIVQMAEAYQDPKSGIVQIDITRVKEYIMEDNGRVHMPIARGSWVLKPLGRNKTSVEHQFLADPGGNIPTSIVNALVVGTPYISLINLKKFVKKKKYQNIKYTWLKEI